MCEALGVKLGKPVAINTENANRAGTPWGPGGANIHGNGSVILSVPAEPDNGTLAVGTIEIRETVDVIFEIE
jgi:hypothetical protein